MARGAPEMLDLSLAFVDKASCKTFFKKFQRCLPQDAAVSVLALESLLRMDEDSKFSFHTSSATELHGIVQRWFERLYNKYRGKELTNERKNVLNLANCLVTFKHPGFAFKRDPNLTLNEKEGYTDLFEWFTKPDDDKKATMFKVLDAVSQKDPLNAALALQGLHSVGNDFVPGKIGLNDCSQTENFRKLLRRMCRKSPCPYQDHKFLMKKVLKALTIFTVLEVPLFIDLYGVKRSLHDYGSPEDIDINGDTPICHAAHQETADKIVADRAFKPSDNKNIVPGVWFGLNSETSEFGSVSFKTKLTNLGVKGLHQGEIVEYDHEVNVILYAHRREGGSFEGLKKPSDSDVKRRNGQRAFVHVSIFVPELSPVWTEMFNVRHSEICLSHFRPRGMSGACKEVLEDRKRLATQREDLDELASKLGVSWDSADEDVE